MWSAYASQQGSCDAVPLLCGGLAVQGTSPYRCPAPPIGPVASPGNVYATGDYIGSFSVVTGGYLVAAGSYPVASSTGG